MMEATKFKVGQVWRDGRGYEILIFAISDLNHSYPIKGKLGESVYSYTIDGQFLNYEQTTDDLIELVRDSGAAAPANDNRQTTEWDVALSGAILQVACHDASRQAGWWNHLHTGLDLVQVINNPQDEFQKLLGSALVAQKLCLSHSEISEAMEGHRKGLKDDKLPHRPMIEVELADAVIRIADLAGALNLDLGGAISEKMAYNAQRADHKPENRMQAGGKAY